MLAAFDPWILAFSLVTVAVTIWMGFRSAKTSKSASDFFVAGRSVSVGWNASAISGEYLSAASFMGVAGMVMSSGYDALWYPVCYACGYLFLLLFIAGPLRRFGAYTIPDFAEGRYDSPLFRKIAVIFVLFIGFFYTMPQMKGAGTTLAYIFPGLPYWVGVVLVGAVITLNVALGGMKGITLVQAFQYWAKMFAISVPIFVLMSVYGGYGKQLEKTSSSPPANAAETAKFSETDYWREFPDRSPAKIDGELNPHSAESIINDYARHGLAFPLRQLLYAYRWQSEKSLLIPRSLNLETNLPVPKIQNAFVTTGSVAFERMDQSLAAVGLRMVTDGIGTLRLAKVEDFNRVESWTKQRDSKLPSDPTAVSAETHTEVFNHWTADRTEHDPRWKLPYLIRGWFADLTGRHSFPMPTTNESFADILSSYRTFAIPAQDRFTFYYAKSFKWGQEPRIINLREPGKLSSRAAYRAFLAETLRANGMEFVPVGNHAAKLFPLSEAARYANVRVPEEAALVVRQPLPAQAPADATWLNPFGPLTTKAAKAAKPSTSSIPASDPTWHTFTGTLPPRDFEDHVARFLRRPNANWMIEDFSTATTNLLVHYARFVASDSPISQGNSFSLVASPRLPSNISSFAFTGPFISEPIGKLEHAFLTNGITVVREPGNVFKAFPTKDAVITPVDPKPYALLYTYSLIIALVCGTAGLPHILVRFYTNPDGVAAKRTTMWVMILIGIFYVFPPVFGVMGRNLMPSLYEGTGAKGTDKVVLELPRILNEGKVGGSTNAASLSPAPSPTFPSAAGQPQAGSTAIPWGSILSGITCAGAFAAFMSTFSGLLVSMTGALAHDVYGRMLRPNSTPAERMRMFKFCAVAVGTVAVVLGSFVEPLQINFMVGQAFAIAAASYFPLLFMSVWWRGMTMRGAAAGMLTGGVCALAAVTLTNFSDLKWIALGDFWAAHPLLRILCEQPAIWTVPLAIGLMVAVSKLTRATVPADVRMKMLVLHAPEKLGLKQEYIKEHEAHGH